MYTLSCSVTHIVSLSEYLNYAHLKLELLWVAFGYGCHVCSLLIPRNRSIIKPWCCILASTSILGSYHQFHPTFAPSFGCIMLAYFQVFHATRSHFVPISVAQPEQLHQQTTTVSNASNGEWRMENAPFRSVWAAIYLWACCVHEYFVRCCCLLLLVGGTYTSFWLPRRT